MGEDCSLWLRIISFTQVLKILWGAFKIVMAETSEWCIVTAYFQDHSVSHRLTATDCGGDRGGGIGVNTSITLFLLVWFFISTFKFYKIIYFILRVV